MQKDHFEVRTKHGKFYVAQVGDELFRDQMGNIKRREVVKRWYNCFDTPLEAQELAARWNDEDGYNE